MISTQPPASTTSAPAPKARRRPSARRANIRRKIWLLRLQEQESMLAAWRTELQWLLERSTSEASPTARRSIMTLRCAMAGVRAAIDELADGAPPSEWAFRAPASAVQASDDELCDDELFKVLI